MNVITGLNDLKVLFNEADEVYYRAKETVAADLATAIDVIELPVLEDGINCDTGEAEVTNIRLTTKVIWVGKVDKGDPDISIQVASIDGVINELFMNKKGDVAATTALIEGKSYKGASYSLSPKKVTGSLFFPSEDKSTILVLTNVEMYSSFVAADGDNPAYFNVSITPLENSEGAEIIIMEEGATE